MNLVPAWDIPDTYVLPWPEPQEWSAPPTSSGELPAAVLDRLWEYCRYPVFSDRSMDACPVCGHLGIREIRNGTSLMLGAGLFVLLDGSRRILVPRHAYHAIVSHGLVPPSELIDLIVNSPDPGGAEFLTQQRILGESGLLTVSLEPK